jgi:hypothetical protein
MLDRDHVAPPEVAKLYDQAVSAQWNALTDIPWSKVPKLPDAIERALARSSRFWPRTSSPHSTFLEVRLSHPPRLRRTGRSHCRGCTGARNDEVRHAHFGLLHVRHALSHDDTLYSRLEGAVRRRAATLSGVGGPPELLQDRVLAAGSTDSRAISRGYETFRELLGTMHESRLRRLEHAGFTAEQARLLSDLHTPNSCNSSGRWSFFFRDRFG